MKNVFRLGVVALSAAVLSAASAANMSSVDVTAKEKGSGKVVYQGKTDRGGKFATTTLQPGKYVLELRSNEPQGFQVALGGTKSAKQVKAKNGLAFDVEIAPASKVTGKVTVVPLTAAQQLGLAKANKNVRIINGKRHVWVRGEIGSHMGGKWVPEEEAEVVNSKDYRGRAGEGLQKMQELSGQGAMGGG